MTGFWLDNPTNLLDSCDIIPTKNMTKVEQFNALTRFILFICAIMYAMDWNYTLPFLVFGIILIVIFYYSQMSSRPQTKESFEHSIKGDNCYVDNAVHLAEVGPRFPGFDPETINMGVNRQKKEIGTPSDKDFVFNTTKKVPGYTRISTVDSLSGNALQSHGYLTKAEVNSLFKGGDRVRIGRDVEPVNVPKCNTCQNNFLGRESIT